MNLVYFIYTSMLKTIKIRLYPNKEEKIYMNQLIGSCRFVYNKCFSIAPRSS